MKSTWPSKSGNLFPTSSRYVQQYVSAEDKRIGSSQTRTLGGGKILSKPGKKLFFFRNTRWRNSDGDCCDVNKVTAWERECGTGWTRQKGQGDPACEWGIRECLRTRELVRTSLRNQTVSHNISSVKSRSDGWRIMVLSSWLGDVTFLLTTMIRGSLSLIY